MNSRPCHREPSMSTVRRQERQGKKEEKGRKGEKKKRAPCLYSEITTSRCWHRQRRKEGKRKKKGRKERLHPSSESVTRPSDACRTMGTVREEWKKKKGREKKKVARPHCLVSVLAARRGEGDDEGRGMRRGGKRKKKIKSVYPSVVCVYGARPVERLVGMKKREEKNERRKEKEKKEKRKTGEWLTVLYVLRLEARFHEVKRGGREKKKDLVSSTSCSYTAGLKESRK